MLRFRISVCSLFFVAAVALSGMDNVATGQIKPFKISGGGIAEYLPFPGDDPAFHFAVGTATHLGKYHGMGRIRTETFDPNTFSGTFSSAEPFVFTAANGDDLAFDYGRDDLNATGPGTFQLFPAGGNKVVAIFVSEFNPNLKLCTGRFKRVIAGSFVMIATTEPFVPGNRNIAYTWEGKGSIEFKKFNK